VGNVKAVIYCRYSSNNQQETSITGQTRECEKYARENGFTVIRQYIDRAKSGTNDNRPEFQRMISDSRLGDFAAVLVYKQDRFSRSVDDTGYYRKILYDSDVEVISVTEQYGDETANLYMDAFNRAGAELYSINLAKLVRRGMHEGALKCRHMGGVPALGYDVDEEHLYVINHEEARTVRIIFDMYTNNHSYNDIIKYLNDRGHRTKTGNTFGKNSIHGILSNEKYSGVYIFNRSAAKTKGGRRNHHKSKTGKDIIRIENGIPAIVTIEIFQQAQKIIKQRKKARGANKAKGIYLLQGLIRCGDCGSMYQGNRRRSSKGSLYISYRCSCKQNKMQCSNKEIKRDAVEGYVLYELEQNVLNLNNIPALVQNVNEQIMLKREEFYDQVKPLQQELDAIDRKIANITKSVENGLVYDELISRLNNLQQRKSDLTIEIKQHESEVKTEELDSKAVTKLFKKYLKIIRGGDKKRIKQIIKEFVKEVTVYEDHVEVKFNMVFSSLKIEEQHKSKTSKDVYGFQKYAL
jgi:site-specific DNA recombinase